MPFSPGDSRSIPFTVRQEDQPAAFGVPPNTTVMETYFQIIQARLAALESQVAANTASLGG